MYQQKTTGPPPLPGQLQQLTSTGPPLLPGQMQQPTSTGLPPLPGQIHQPTSTGPQPLPGQMYQQTATGPPPLPGQLQQPTSTGPPPLPGQMYQQKTTGPPPLPGQMYQQKTTGPPPLPGQLQQPTATGQAMNYQSQRTFGTPLNTRVEHRPNQTSYPNLQAPQNFQDPSQMMSNMSIQDKGQQPINLIQLKRILPQHKSINEPMSFDSYSNSGSLVPPGRKNCHPEVMRCTLNAIPNTQALLSQVKLPFGLIVHPFKDLTSLPVISAGTIVRCKRCRTYINPFVYFLEPRKWRCNVCYTVNETPEEFLRHPGTNVIGQPHTRPECTNSTIEFIAPHDYMVRPPQPAVYLMLLDVSHSAVKTGYLKLLCDTLLENLRQLPGDKRTLIGFISYNRTVHFYRINESFSQPQMMVVSDVDDIFIPTSENLMVNLHENLTVVEEFLRQLPLMHSHDDYAEEDTYSALGAALEVAYKLMYPYGGRVSVFQQSIPCIGPGKLTSREDPNLRASSKIDVASLNPATDFYKKKALDCSERNIAVDFFFLNSQYIDIATLSCASRFSAGDIHYYPGLHVVHSPMEAKRFVHDLERYFTRKIGFESVMRIRCSKGISFQTFHGNFFVRSPDLLSLSNINPDAGFAANIKIEENLTDMSAVCFQAALLYTSSKVPPLPPPPHFIFVFIPG